MKLKYSTTLRLFSLSICMLVSAQGWSVTTESQVAVAAQTEIAADPVNVASSPAVPTTAQARAIEGSSKARKPLILDQALINDIEAQRKRLVELRQTENAFSLLLGENYAGYGALLEQAGRFEQALQAYTQGLHIQKVNSGVYALEQRQLLKKMFDISFMLDDEEGINDSLGRILWVEGKSDGKQDHFSYELLMKAGYFYLDQVLERNLKREIHYQYLRAASSHFRLVVHRYLSEDLDKTPLPFGELALVGLLERQLAEKFQQHLLSDLQNNPSFRRFSPNNTGGTQDSAARERAQYLINGPKRARNILGLYISTALDQENLPHSVKASLAMADLARIMDRSASAKTYYQAAWKAAQMLDQNHILMGAFQQPVLLPAFPYTKEGYTAVWRRANTFVPVTLAVSKNGKPKNLRRPPEEHPNAKYFGRISKVIKKHKFRSSMVDGELVDTEQTELLAGLYIRPPKEKQTKTNNSPSKAKAANSEGGD